MKKMYQVLAFVAIMFAFSNCDDKKIITVADLPQAAQAYIQENMADEKVLYVKKERDSFQTTYEVRFENQVELEFKSDGTLIDIDYN